MKETPQPELDRFVNAVIGWTKDFTPNAKAHVFTRLIFEMSKDMDYKDKMYFFDCIKVLLRTFKLSCYDDK